MKQRYESYKPTEIDWIGEIPEHWSIENGKYLLNILPGFPVDSNLFVTEEDGFPLIRIRDINSDNTEVKYSGVVPKDYIIRKGDILVGMDGDFNIAKWQGPNALLNHIVCKVSGSSKYLAQYTYYVLPKLLKRINDVTYATTVKHLSTYDISNAKLPVPPVAEQKAIADYLDKKCGKIDSAIAKVDREIELIEELKQSEISRVVTRGLNLDAPLRPSRIDWIGAIPSHWNCIKIKNLSPVLRGASPRPIDDPKYFDENGEFSWVRIADVTSSERYLTKTTQKLSNLGASLSVKRYPGDIFLSIAGTVGKPIITTINCCIHDGFVWFPLLRINPEFLYYIFMTGQPYRGLGTFGTQLNLNTDTVGNIFIPLPPKSEIDQIITYLDKKCAEIDSLKSKLKRKRDTLVELRQSMISEVVTGKRKVI